MEANHQCLLLMPHDLTQTSSDQYNAYPISITVTELLFAKLHDKKFNVLSDSDDFAVHYHA